MNKVLTAAGLQVEGYYPGLFVKALKGQNITTLLSNAGSGSAPVAAAAGPATGAAAAKDEKPAEKKEEVKEPEADVDMGDLFGGGDY